MCGCPWYKRAVVSQRVLRVWIAVAAVLAATAVLGWWFSRPDASAWGRDDGVASSGEVSQQSGEGGCEGLALLEVSQAAALSVSGTFVRDAAGVLGEDLLEAHFARPNGSLRRFGPEATLPEGAVETPWTRGDGAALWLAPENDDFAFVAGDRVEAWPRADGLLCGAPGVG